MHNKYMNKSKEILVTTTSTIEGIVIKKYLRPISSHLVAGTNLFSDFFGGITDIIGGKSFSYQKQLTSLYDDSIENLKKKAVEIGANAIIGLSVDLDEISGKGKSMFMLTAIGTAVIIKSESSNILLSSNISVEQINDLNQKKKILKEVEDGSLRINKDCWEFITKHQFDEIYDYVVSRFQNVVENENVTASYEGFKSNFIEYLESFDEVKRKQLIYSSLKKVDGSIFPNKILNIIKELYLLDFKEAVSLIKSDRFDDKKRALILTKFDKRLYQKSDIIDITNFMNEIKISFPDKGSLTVKKQLLSSKEKEVWNCECGKTNDLGNYCNSCGNDIKGFKVHEVKPLEAINYLQNKMELLNELLEG